MDTTRSCKVAHISRTNLKSFIKTILTYFENRSILAQNKSLSSMLKINHSPHFDGTDKHTHMHTHKMTIP